MSLFHESVRNLFEDVYSFLSTSLANEKLSTSSSTEKESLLNRLLDLRQCYPELHLEFNQLSYVDMNKNTPCNVDKDNYDEVNSKDCSETQSFTLSEDSEADSVVSDVAACDLHACEKAGYLDKRRGSLRGWLSTFQRRWCAVQSGVFYYYEKPTDRKQKGHIRLTDYEARKAPQENCFELVCPGKKTYQFCASSDEDLKKWINAIEEARQGSSWVCAWPCEASREDELSLSSGEHVRVLETTHPDWWVAEANGKVGFVPRAYLTHKSTEA